MKTKPKNAFLGDGLNPDFGFEKICVPQFRVWQIWVANHSSKDLFRNRAVFSPSFSFSHEKDSPSIPLQSAINIVQPSTNEIIIFSKLTYIVEIMK